MFSKKLVYVLMAVFAFLAISALIVNMPEKKDPQVIEKIKPWFPYEMTKTLGGLDLLDKRTGRSSSSTTPKSFSPTTTTSKSGGKTI